MGQGRRNWVRSQVRVASIEFSRELVFAHDDACHRKFCQRFGSEIDTFIVAAFEANQRVESAMKRWAKNQRVDHLKLFLHTSLNHLYCSVHFLVSGYMQPAGHQLRCYAEAVAMAMLILVDTEWTKFAADRSAYPVHKATDRIKKRPIAAHLKRAVGLDEVAWTDFQRIQEFYNNHSHAGALTLAMNIKLDWPGSTISGGEYDPAKQAEYRADLRRATAGARSLAAFIDALDVLVPTLVP
jgi:hypothetical protein